jgi:hypothetical protein
MPTSQGSSANVVSLEFRRLVTVARRVDGRPNTLTQIGVNARARGPESGGNRNGFIGISAYSVLHINLQSRVSTKCQKVQFPRGLVPIGYRYDRSRLVQ